MSNKAKALYCAAHTVLSYGCGALGWYWQQTLEPTLPLVPAAMGALAFLSAAMAGVYFSAIKGQ